MAATVGASLWGPLDPNPRSFLETLTPQPHRMKSVGVRKHRAVRSVYSGPVFPSGQWGQVLVSSQTPQKGE